ncbi:hypothetical protein BHM03_00062070 [Ensete ventricosum]|nr:hypothetical protein BHM03_00062070 [Ensete ventricosum]
MCQAFPTTLRGLPREWYNRFKLLSISSFAQLAKEFELHLGNIRLRSYVMMLLGLRKREHTPSLTLSRNSLVKSEACKMPIPL